MRPAQVYLIHHTVNRGGCMRQRLNVRDMTVCALFTTLTAVGAFIKIPVPVVPFTLQFLFTTMAGLLLGKRLGALSVAVYVALGLAGLPIFAEGGGLGYLFRPSFGYLIGFCAGAWVTGAIAEKGGRKPGFGRLLAANFAGLFVVYLFGMVYYYVIGNYVIDSPIGIWPLFLYCFLLAVPGDIALCILGAALGRRIIPVLGIEVRRNGKQATAGLKE